MANYAAVTLVGHLGQSPETKTANSGTEVTRFSIATSKKDGQGNETTTWWNCTCFGKRGGIIAQYFNKGDPILIQGEPSLRKYTAKDGSQASSLDVIVNDFSFIKGRKDADSDYAPAQRQTAQPKTGSPADPQANWEDDVPF